MNKKWDLLLKNGFLYDPSQNQKGTFDIAVLDGKIAAISSSISSASAKQTVDLSGYYVFPGLIDMHCHIYPSSFYDTDCLPCVHADSVLFQNGVTTAVDAGTCGPRDFYRFKESFIDKSPVRILSFINIASGGMVSLSTEQDPHCFSSQAAAEIAKEFSDTIVGIKTAHYWVNRSFDDLHTPWASVDKTLEAAELCGKIAMFDFQPSLPERSYQDLLLNKMRPADIHTHVYAQQFPVLDPSGSVSDFLFEAREKGIVFDLGHGAASFWFRNAIPAYKNGFYPDTLSTDLYLDNICGPVFGMENIMSKYLNIGMPLEEIVSRTTTIPAQVIGHPELGSLRIGSCADIAVFHLSSGNFGFYDGGHARMPGTKKLECVMTIRNGKIVYDLNALSMVPWENAPASYWSSPGIINY